MTGEWPRHFCYGKHAGAIYNMKRSIGKVNCRIRCIILAFIFETPGSVSKRMRIKTLLDVQKNIKKVLTRFVKDVTIHKSHGISALILKE